MSKRKERKKKATEKRLKILHNMLFVFEETRKGVLKENPNMFGTKNPEKESARTVLKEFNTLVNILCKKFHSDAHFVRSVAPEAKNLIKHRFKLEEDLWEIY
jgi:hypothetical protein